MAAGQGDEGGLGLPGQVRVGGAEAVGRWFAEHADKIIHHAHLTPALSAITAAADMGTFS